MNDLFRIVAKKASLLVGSAFVFILAFLLVVIWLITGPFFHYSDTWQLIINTATTVITFLVVFLIQNTQNREMQILQLKLDELIRSHEPAQNSCIDLEKLSDDQIRQLEERYKKLSREIRTESENE